MLYLFFSGIFILPLIQSENSAVPSQEINPNLLPAAASSNKTKLTLPSEGGNLLASIPDLSLPKDKLASLALDGELESLKKPIQGRKGVNNNTNKFINLKITTELQNITAALKTSNASNGSHPLTTKINADVNIMNATLDISNPINSTEVPKKPRVLSYEALVNADKNIHQEVKILESNPSSKTFPNLSKTQIPSPNEESIVKVYPAKANSHPGMIMPIVITIVVVPMFAIVGYMAVRRGQEAWKNRHYKRMDFLLDGMYND